MIRLKKSGDYIQRQDYNSLYWLTSVSGAKSDVRHHINTIHIDSGVAVKTDGSRLHVACLEGDFPDGDYEIIKRTKSEIVINLAEKEGDWPEWERVFKDCPVPFNGTDFQFDIFVDEDFMGGSLARFYRDFHAGGDVKPLVNADFIEAALEGFNNALVWFTDVESPLFFVDSGMDRVAVLMPLRP
ncbi:MAG: hypothetical protein GY774_35600 [Planctomycetes bacterium]|nr:hypothetical protein [Planctomycetota bacterium]